MESLRAGKPILPRFAGDIHLHLDGAQQPWFILHFIDAQGTSHFLQKADRVFFGPQQHEFVIQGHIMHSLRQQLSEQGGLADLTCPRYQNTGEHAM